MCYLFKVLSTMRHTKHVISGCGSLQPLPLSSLLRRISRLRDERLGQVKELGDWPFLLKLWVPPLHRWYWFYLQRLKTVRSISMVISRAVFLDHN